MAEKQRTELGGGKGLLSAIVGGYSFLVMLLLACSTVYLTVLYYRATSAITRERERAQHEIELIRAQLRTGDRLPVTTMTSLHERKQVPSDSLALRYDLIYFFSPDCPICRRIDSTMKAASVRLRFAWVSTRAAERTLPYVDSLGVREHVWTVDTVGLHGILGTPTLVQVIATPRGAIVENVASGQRGVAFLLSRESGMDSVARVALERLATTRRW